MVSVVERASRAAGSQPAASSANNPTASVTASQRHNSRPSRPSHTVSNVLPVHSRRDPFRIDYGIWPFDDQDYAIVCTVTNHALHTKFTTAVVQKTITTAELQQTTTTAELQPTITTAVIQQTITTAILQQIPTILYCFQNCQSNNVPSNPAHYALKPSAPHNTSHLQYAAMGETAPL